MQTQQPYMAHFYTLQTHASPEETLQADRPPIGGSVKRTKVSRACDECRRKKTRCDLAPVGCSTCRRANIPCTFARAQLKRGPTKRRSSETSGGSPPKFPTSPLVSLSTQQPPQNNTLDVSLPGIGSLLPWQPLEPSLGSSNSLSPQMQGEPLAPPLPRSSYYPLRAQNLPLGTGTPAKPDPIWRPIQTSVNEEKLNEYYKHCHPVFPILPDTLNELNEFLSFMPCSDWLISVINGTARTAPVDPHSAMTPQGHTMQLMALLLLYLQTLDFMWLGAAVGNILALNSYSAPSQHSKRLYTVVAVLDKIHSMVFKTEPMLARVPRPYALYAPERIRKIALILGIDMCEDNMRSPPPEPTDDPISEVIYLLSHAKQHNVIQKLKDLLQTMEKTPLALYIHRVCDGR